MAEAKTDESNKATWNFFLLSNSPYPLYTDIRSHAKQAAGIGVLIAILLFAFQPFGLSNVESTAWLFFISIIFGATTVGVVITNWLSIPSLFPSWFIEQNWTVGKEIIYVLWNFFTVGSANFLVMILFGNSFSFQDFISMQVATLAVGALPVALSTIWSHNRLLTRALKDAEQMQSLQIEHDKRHSQEENTHLITLSGKNLEEEISLKSLDLRCLRADGNYVEVYYAPSHLERPAILRSTLAELQEQINSDLPILRCHRGFVAHLDHVENYTGNAQGLKLIMKDLNLKIPVSRSYLQTVKNYLQS
jgi:DNA-binding LytR/AlgR family response regulator